MSRIIGSGRVVYLVPECFFASVHVCARCSPIVFAAMTHHASQQNVGPFQEAQARRELLPKADVAKHSVASRLSLKMRTSCFSHGRHRGNKDTNTTSVRFQHPRGSHDPRNYRTWTQVDISKFHTCLSVFLQFPFVAFGRSCNAGRKPSHQCRMRLIPGLAEF